MAPSRTTDSTTPRTQQIVEADKPNSPNSGKPLTGLQNRPEDADALQGNPYFPRFGSQADHDTYVDFLRETFHAKKEGDMALRIAKAMKKFVDSVWGLSPVGRPRAEPPDEGDTPDIGERSMASAAGVVSTDAASYSNPFDNHYSLIAQQAQQSAMSVHS